MRFLLRWMVAGLVLTTGIGNSWAGAQEEPTMETVVVTASREKEKAVDVPASVTVIDRKDIEDSTAQYVPELLAPQGLQVRDIMGNRRVYSVDLRGFGVTSPANLLVMVDGRRINEADLSGVDWTLIPLENIERIEIIRGAQGSVLYGDNATAGLVNIITKKGRKPHVRVGAAYGSYDTFKTDVSASTGGERASLGVSGSYLNSDGYRENSDTEAKSLGISINADPTDKASLNFSGGYHKDETGMPGAITQSQMDAGASRTESFHPDDFLKVEDWYSAGSAEVFILTGDAFKFDAGLRRRSYDSLFTGDFYQFKGSDQLSTWNVSPRLVFNGDFNEVSNRVILGWEYSDDKLDINNWSWAAGSGSSKKRATLKKENEGFYVHDQLDVNAFWSLSGGYRHDRALFTFDDDTGGHEEVLRSLDAFNMGINYKYAPRSHLYAEYSESFRYPLLDEFFNRIYNTVDDRLKPQRSYTYQIGIKNAFTSTLYADLHLFKIETADEIFYNADMAVSANQNMDGNTERRGVEFALRYAGEAFKAGLSYCYTKAEVLEGRYADRIVPGVPEHQASADAAYSFPFGLYLGLDALYVGERYFDSDLENVAPRQDAYTLVNAKVRYPWRWLTFFVDLNNIFNQEYASYGVYSDYLGERSYYPSPEFNMLAGVTLRWPI
ncbi:MAG: TonB-dependent receptor [Desulfosarcinaceae bacterium]